MFIPFWLPVGNDRQMMRFPYVGLGVVVLCVLVEFWSWVAYFNQVRGEAMPGPIELGGFRPVMGVHYSLVTSAFVHGGWFHLLGNMAFLYVTAMNLEDRWGWPVFLPFYLGGAVVSALLFGALHPTSTIPLVGASGAIAGTMGAFLVCFHSARVRFWYFWWVIPPIRPLLFTGTFFLRAYIVLPIWFGLELLNVFFEGGSMVAHSAHVGGFVYGLVFASLMLATGMDAQRVEIEEKKSEVWAEDPDYLVALDHLEAGDRSRARARLLEVVSRSPNHADARAALARIGAQEAELAAAAAHGSVALEVLANGDPAAVLALFRELTELAPEIAFTDAALHRVAQAGRAARDPELSFVAYRRLLLTYPASPLAPRVLYEAAEAQELQGRGDLARTTLENLIAVFPTEPLADSARRRLLTLARPS